MEKIIDFESIETNPAYPAIIALTENGEIWIFRFQGKDKGKWENLSMRPMIPTKLNDL